jgi:hypothetical protein
MFEVRRSFGWFLLGVVSAAAAGAADSKAWQIEVVDASGAGKFTSMKVDKLGNVHVAYVFEDGNRYPLRYAFWDATLKKWFKITVAEGAGPCSLALDSKQRPHISYVQFGAGSGAKLQYAKWDGAAWKIQAIPLSSDIIAYYNSLILDGNDNPSISFYEYRGPKETEFRIRLRNVMFRGDHWEVRTIDSQEGSGKFNSAAIDAKGNVHVAYANVSAGTAGIRYARWNGVTWNAEVVEGMGENNGDTVGYSAGIAVDGEGDPHITYVNASRPMLKYAVRKGGKWQIYGVDRLGGVAYPDRNSIAIDEKGMPYIGYYDAGRGLLKVAYPSGKNWTVEVVDGNGSGFTSSIQVDRHTVWISYADQANGALKVAHREVADTATISNSMPAGGGSVKP